MKMLVVGGAGDFGSFYAKLFARNGLDVSINDTSEGAAKKICEEHKLKLVTDLRQVKDFEMVLISVPNKDAGNAIKKFSKLMKKDSLLAEVCSVKTPIEKELFQSAKRGLEVLSLHPMHGPRVENIRGQSIAVIFVKKGKKSEELLKVFEKEGATLVETNAKEHDKMLAVVQGLTHFSQFVAAATLKEMAADLKKTNKLSTPNHNLFLSLVSRVVLQNPDIYSEIQLANPMNKKVRKAFVKSAKELAKICEKKDPKLLAKKIIESAQQFKEGELFLIESDRAVAAQKHINDLIHRNVGNKFLVENLLNHSMHYGTIKSLTPHDLTIKEHNHETKLALQKIRITTKQEMKEWKEKHLQKKTLDFSFLVPKNAKNEAIVNALSKTLKHSFEIIDEYSGVKIPEGKKSITVRATIFEDDDKESVNSKTLETIKGLGYEQR